MAEQQTLLVSIDAVPLQLFWQSIVPKQQTLFPSKAWFPKQIPAQSFSWGKQHCWGRELSVTEAPLHTLSQSFSTAEQQTLNRSIRSRPKQVPSHETLKTEQQTLLVSITAVPLQIPRQSFHSGKQHPS